MVRPKLKLVFQDFAESTTAHAPPKILTHTHIVSKLFWALLFITGLGTFLYFSQDLISTYLQYGKTTDIELRFRVLEFPAVTVCNQNQFRADRLPDGLRTLLDDFLVAKREDMFGGREGYDEYMRGKEEEEQYGANGAAPTVAAPTVAAPTGAAPTGAAPTAAAPTAAAPTAAAPTAAAPTAAAPTAAAPTAAAPTAAAPTAAAPTAAAPTAAAPTDAAPTSASPTSASPTSASPTSASPTSASPTSAAPTSASPTSASPTGAASTGAASTGAASTGAASTGAASTDAASTDAASTGAAPTGGPPPGKKRKRRSIEPLTESENVIIDDMMEFYSKPEIKEIDNMTWFKNVGETSSEKEILLNLTQYISTEYSREMLIDAGHDIQEMLQECVFLGKTCGPEDFYHFYDMKYGNCYTFNSGMNRTVAKITNPGASFGLSMTFFINQGQYMPVLTQEAGLRVMLHRQGQVPIMEEDGFDISPGTKSGIAVKYVEVSRLTGAHADCIDKFERNETHEYYPGNYTQKACLKTCLQKGIIERCGCATPLYRYPDGVTMCGPAEDECVEIVEADLLDSKTCSNKCPTPCWESQYQYVISGSQWPSNSYMPYLKESLDERGDTMKGVMSGDARTGLSEQFLKMVVYYDNLNYNRYTERLTITEKDLIGALGGHLGLWIGMSIVSFVEFFELILLLIKWSIYKIHNNKTSSRTDLGDEDREKTHTPVHRFNSDVFDSKEKQ